jgi:hypothetical protein
MILTAKPPIGRFYFLRRGIALDPQVLVMVVHEPLLI